MTMPRSVGVAALLFAVSVSGSSVWASAANPTPLGKLAFTLEEMNGISSDSQNQIPCPELSRS